MQDKCNSDKDKKDQEMHRREGDASLIACVSHTFVGKPQEEGVMSVAASFPSVCQTKVIELVGVENAFKGVNYA